MLPIKHPQCSISSLISFMNSDAVHGPERCTINSTPPGVSRVLGTDSAGAKVSNWEAMDNMNIKCHWVINQINPWVEDLRGINVIYRAWQRRICVEHLLKIINYSLFGLEVTQEQSALPSVSSVHTEKRGKHSLAAPLCCRNSLIDEFSEQITRTHALFLYSFIKQFSSHQMHLSWAPWGSKRQQDTILTCAMWWTLHSITRLDRKIIRI